MPTLALQSQTVYHSLLALSAACLCCDMICSGMANPRVVRKLLLAGYQHHTATLEQMRALIAEPQAINREPMLATAVMVVPFSIAFQHVNHWVLRNTSGGSYRKRLSVRARDTLILVRGVKTVLLALDSTAATSPALVPPTGAPWTTGLTPEAENMISSTIPANPSRTHLMFPILTATSERAFSSLETAINFVSLDYSHDSATVSACAEAFDVLNNIRIDTFTPSDYATAASWKDETNYTLDANSSLATVASWLRSYAARPGIPSESEPMYRSFLAFFIRAPQVYWDLLIPLLDQRLESPMELLSDDAGLTAPQAIALDIYAHWLVMMFLVESESWWIGDLPVVGLRGMINRYGERFAVVVGPDRGFLEGWWPGSMLKIKTELQRCE